MRSQQIEKWRRINLVIYCVGFMLMVLIVGISLVVNAQTLREPTTNADGSPLMDLEGCTVEYTETFSGAVSTLFLPASSPNGGQSRPVTIPRAEGRYHMTAVCQDTKGNVSGASNALEVTFPAIPPAAPTLVAP